MTLLRRTTLTFVAAMLPMGLLLISPLASNISPNRLIEPREPAFENYLAQGAPTAAPAQLKYANSVLGIEVRSSHEKNVGRIVDLLADKGGAVEAAVIEFGGFLGIGTRKIAIAWSDLRFETEGNQLIAILDIPRDQLRAAPDYKPDRPTIVTKTIQPLMPSTEEPRTATHRRQTLCGGSLREDATTIIIARFSIENRSLCLRRGGLFRCPSRMAQAPQAAAVSSRRERGALGSSRTPGAGSNPTCVAISSLEQ